MLAGPGRKPAHINQKYGLLASTSVWDYLNIQIEGALGKLSIYTAKTSQQCDLHLQEQYKLYYFSFNSELPSCNKLIFKVLPNPTHSVIAKSPQLPEDLCAVLRSWQHFTCTPGLTGTGYIIFGAKQTG